MRLFYHAAAVLTAATFILSGCSTEEDPQETDGSVSSARSSTAQSVASSAQSVEAASSVPDSSETSSGSSVASEAPLSSDDASSSVITAVSSTTSSLAVSSSAMEQNLSDVALAYDTTPAKGETTTIALRTEAKITTIDWKVTAEPEGSALYLEVSDDLKSVTFTPQAYGTYTIALRSQVHAIDQNTSFTLRETFAYDEAKVQHDDKLAADEAVGVVTDQAWVWSAALQTSERDKVIVSFPALTILGHDDTFGTLVTFDDTNLTALESLELLAYEPGIDTVFRRLHEGENADRSDAVFPNDGESFVDGGDNWHLEHIGMPEAWEYTRGLPNARVGVVDAGFYADHFEFERKIREVLTDRIHYHGTAVAGSIGALTDNGTGVSGTNWYAKLILHLYNLANERTVAEKTKLHVINNSWATPGHIPETFDPTDPTEVEERILQAQERSFPFRTLSRAFDDKLFVYSGGNGIGNAKGNKDGVTGVDARFLNGAIHYTERGSFARRRNVVVVAAMMPDEKLIHYSSYGASIDIAAPTLYRTLDINDSFKRRFGGTSAAAPVVSGVASLIYSLYPGFSGEEVKHFLIKGATDYVTERYADKDHNTSEVLERAIPQLNAANALKLAQAYLDEKLRMSTVIPDPFRTQAEITFTSIDPDFVLTGISVEVEASNNYQDWHHHTSAQELSGFTLDFDGSSRYYRMQLTATMHNAHNGMNVTVKPEFTFTYHRTSVCSRDAATLESLPDTYLEVYAIGSTTLRDLWGWTDASGCVTLYLEDDASYRILGSREGYQNTTLQFQATAPSALHIEYLDLTEGMDLNTAHLRGRIVAIDGNPLPSVVVRISGGLLTNGYFASAKTDANGYFTLSNLSRTDGKGTAIPSFALEAARTGYATLVKEKVLLLKGKTKTVNFTLIPKVVEQAPVVIYHEDFESLNTEWIPYGMWNYMDLNYSMVVNAVAGYNVMIAGDEYADYAALPAAYSGAFAWWYGDRFSGNYLGSQEFPDAQKSGGTSTEPNSGTLTSPLISLDGASSAVLRFRTWWEIESYAAMASEHDQMDVQISTDNGATWTTLRNLNPTVEPYVEKESRRPVPYSSGGFYRAPLWVQEEIDLGDYAGEEIRIRFAFDTVDRYMNGFRGWLIDDFEIINE